MRLPPHSMNRRHAGTRLAALSALALASVLSACAGLPGQDPLRVNVVGVEGLPGEGFEIRFAVKLRVQNPNDNAVEFDGISIDLDVNGKPLASGVSGERGTVPRFGELVFTVPVTVSAFAAVRQALGLANGSAANEWPYALRGRLSGGLFGSVRFAAEGSLKLPQ
jgi:LEA14-like dessication related protein